MLFFGNSRPLALLTAVPYILGCELVFFRKERFFVKLKEQVIGIFVLREQYDVLFASSLAVAPEYRRYGVATYILTHCAKLANELGKKWLELNGLEAELSCTSALREIRLCQERGQEKVSRAEEKNQLGSEFHPHTRC